MRPTLAKGEEVVTAWAERASGPGWSNQLVWAFVRGLSGDYRLIALQPTEWQASPTLSALFGVSAVVSEDMRAAAAALLREKKP